MAHIGPSDPNFKPAPTRAGFLFKTVLASDEPIFTDRRLEARYARRLSDYVPHLVLRLCSLAFML